MRLATILLAGLLALTAAATTDGQFVCVPARSRSVVVIASSAGSMSDCFGAIKENAAETIDALNGPDKVDVMFFSDGEPTKAADQLIAADAAGKKKGHDFIDAAKAGGKSDPVPALTSALALKPDLLLVLLDDVPDGNALAKAVKAGDPDGTTRINVVYAAGTDTGKTKTDTDAIHAAVAAVRGRLVVIKKSDLVTPPAGAVTDPVVFALSNSGSMLAVLGDERDDIVKTVATLPAGTNFDVIVFSDGESKSMTPAPAASDAKSKGATGDFLRANPAKGHGEPVAGVKAALAMKPGTLYLTLDQVPDPTAFTKAFDAGDPKKTVVPIVTFLTGNDSAKDEAAVAALDKIVEARHGTLKTVKESDVAAGK